MKIFFTLKKFISKKKIISKKYSILDQKMEIFKSNILKKEFERFQKEDLLNELECSYCEKTKCGWRHGKFQPDCQYCKKKFCKNCHKFYKAFEMLLEQADEIGKDYLKNSVKDF